jgi:CRISPR-associated protein Csd1
LLAGALFAAILANTPYPAALFYGLINRIRADMDDPAARISKINCARAAAIKAYLLRKYRFHLINPFKGGTDHARSMSSPPILHTCSAGCSPWLEKVQQEAIPEAKATIKDRYFTSACASPASVFPILLRLSTAPYRHRRSTAMRVTGRFRTS